MKQKELCCERFAEAIKAKEIIHADQNDETEWFISELGHLYYCPFCGAYVKGKGWGEYNPSGQRSKRQREKMKPKRNC
jgi:hypothetical protein